MGLCDMSKNIISNAAKEPEYFKIAEKRIESAKPESSDVVNYRVAKDDAASRLFCEAEHTALDSPWRIAPTFHRYS